MSLAKTGLIGCGVIGGALLRACVAKGIPLAAYDKFIPQYSELKEVLQTRLVFVCVPTPTGSDGKQDHTAIEDVLMTLSQDNYPGVVCLRSTLVPGQTANFQMRFPKLRLTHCPEFLTAARPLEDLIAQPAVIIGASSANDQDVVEKFWIDFDSRLKVIKFNMTTQSEMAKYMHNLFLATKVSLLNDFYEACQSMCIDYNHTVQAAIQMGGIGAGHTRVPGPDGQLGYGGMCFPKDMNAFYEWCNENEIHAETIGGAIAGNKRRRGL